MDIEKYNDIINLPHHVSKKYPQMSLEERSAQFAPFAALTGYEDAVEETARSTENRIDIDEDVKVSLNEKFELIARKLKDNLVVEITYFIPDKLKDGGEYVTVKSEIKKFDKDKQILVLNDETIININEIFDIKINNN